MLACSLAHEGKENLSLARLQVTQDPFGRFPGDLALEPCRQCLDPECLKACPTGALHVDKADGNVRIGDKDLARAIGEISRREMDEPEKLLHVRGLMAARLGQSRRIRRLP